MRGTRNVDDLKERLRAVFQAAQEVRATLDEVAIAVNSDPEEAAAGAALVRKKEWLECHARDFVLDHLLAALNWQMMPTLDATPYVQANLVIEQPPDAGGQPRRKLKPADKEKRKRMDYLGYERSTDRPLLVLEAKRPELQLPGGPVPDALPQQHPAATVISEYLAKTRGTESVEEEGGLTVEWQKYLSQIRKYAREVSSTRNAWPKRVVLSNGEWVVVFIEPEAAFTTEQATVMSAGTIQVFESWDHIVSFAQLLWEHLEYGVLARTERECDPSELAFLINPQNVQSCMFALRVLYAEVPAIYERRPCLKVSPVLVVRSEGTSFILVSSRMEIVVPNDKDEALGSHCEEVSNLAHALKGRVEEVLGRGALPLVSIESHMREAIAFGVRPAVQELPRRRVTDPEVQVIAITGTHPHLLVPDPAYSPCPRHKHSASVQANSASHNHPAAAGSREPKSYFADGSWFHCTHREVFGPKGQPVTQDNRERCGPRSTADGGAFCEIWKVEEMLCCRTCVYQGVCTGSQAFRIPCPRPETLVQVTASARSA